MNRWQTWPILHWDMENSRLAQTLGSLRPVAADSQTLYQELQNLRHWKISVLALPPNWIHHPLRDEIWQWTRQLDLQVIYQVAAPPKPMHWSFLNDCLAQGLQIEALWDDSWSLADIQQMAIWPLRYHTLVVHTQSNAEDILENLETKYALADLHVYIASDVNCDDAQLILQTLREHYPHLNFRPHPSGDRWYAPLPMAQLRLHTQLQAQPALSIVIPHLAHQPSSLAHWNFRWLLAHHAELIVVDDGSSAEALQDLHATLNTHTAVPLQLIELQRTAEDKRHRAGLARHIGAVRARSEKILFVDSDIQINSDTLSEAWLKLQTQNVVLFRRDWTGVTPSEAHYWQTWQDDPTYDTRPDKWRYFSSACVAMRRSCYLSGGGFATGFNNYGSEDTLLGYRLKDYNWALSDTPVHDLQLAQRRGTLRQNHNRRLALRASAQELFRITQDPSVYETLFSFLGSGLVWRALLKKMTTHRTGRLLVLFPLFYFLTLWLEPSFYIQQVTWRLRVLGIRSKGLLLKWLGWLRKGAAQTAQPYHAWKRERWKIPHKSYYAVHHLYHYAKKNSWRLRDVVETQPRLLLQRPYHSVKLNAWRGREGLLSPWRWLYHQSRQHFWRLPWLLLQPWYFCKYHIWRVGWLLLQPWYFYQKNMWRVPLAYQKLRRTNWLAVGQRVVHDTRAWLLNSKVTYPFRKLFYFARYRMQKSQSSQENAP